TEYPDKKVVLIHSRIGLADPVMMPHVRQQAKEVLLEKGVELLLGQKVNELSELQLNKTQKNMQVRLDSGETLTTDLIISCTGLRINSAAYSLGLMSSMSDTGALRVNQYLQVHGFTNIFAVGDCSDTQKPKTAYLAGLQGPVAVTNILNGLRGAELKPYLPGNVSMLVAMGRNDGVGQFNGYRLPRFLVTWGKSRDLLLWMSWKEMQQTQPQS
ncbi:ferroptosis suppressor protein 1-like, partial [Oryzias melastigma]|uniref:ferroptosis suppressor protein 1-like n=1 Tax=Oryzias melastigma TaxID=30732 RepID=UPI000CF7F778